MNVHFKSPKCEVRSAKTLRPMNAHFKLFGLLISVVLLQANGFEKEGIVKQNLSEYGFFSAPLNRLQPAANVFSYDVNAPLFSDYAEKARFIFLPPGTKMDYRENGAYEFPEGAVLIKNFYYPGQETETPEKDRHIIETRLLLKETKGWKALAYVWNAEQTEATLEVAGATLPLFRKPALGKKQEFSYIVPNLNQCKGCHSYDGRFIPIGITTKQLNRFEPGGTNQLLTFQKLGVLDLPQDFDAAKAPMLADYRQNGKTEDMARAYLDANCAHCHNPHGPASTSGMFLDVTETDPEHLGVGKPPVAAGRGSGNRKYGIVPGKPSESILLYRMESDDPGIRMPELGRQLMHKEGVELIEAWIRAL